MTRMSLLYRMILCGLALAAGVQACAQTPVVTGIFNHRWSPSTIAPGSIGYVLGSNFGTAGNTSVTVGGMKAETLAVSSKQIRALFPPTLPPGFARLNVTVDGRVSSAFNVIVSAQPAGKVALGRGSMPAGLSGGLPAGLPGATSAPRVAEARPALKNEPAAPGIVYTCDATIYGASATACDTLNTTIAGLYSSAFSNANASIYITLGETGLGMSNWVFNYESYSSFRNALIASEGDPNDITAVADSVPAVNPYGSDSVGLVNALERALGFGAPGTGLEANFDFCSAPGTAGCYDGIITISNAEPLYFRSGEISSGQYDFFTVAEHETDEILGTASSCCGASNSYVLPADYFRYHSQGTRSFAYGSNDACSSSDSTNACFSLDGVHMLQQYNNLNNGEDTGDWVFNCAHQLVQDYALCSGVAGVDISPTAEILVLDVVGYTLASSQPPPTVTTGVAGSITSSGATLNGTVNPNGASANYWFLYGTDSSLAGALQTSAASVGNGTTAVPVEDSIADLGAGTTYYYQLQASNSAAIVGGSIASFTTQAACTYSLTSTSASFGAAASSGSVGVTSPSGCSWTASSNASWLAITSGSSGSGDGTVGYSFGANTGEIALFGTLTIAGQTFTVTQAANPAPLAFYPLTPCRIADTRAGSGFSGAFGPPYLSGGATRSFPLPSSSCSVPDAALAYSVNFGALPHGPLGYLTAWPAGSPLPLVGTLGSPAGQQVSNAAIVPAGTVGTIDIFVSDDTDLIIDINGYFAAPNLPTPLAFYPITPCRVADTRVDSGLSGAFGAPYLSANVARIFPMPSSSCDLPATAQAYSLNFGALPYAPLGYLTAWPAGSSLPLVGTLGSPSGSPVSNAALVPAGTGGAISIDASADTELIVDSNGYFAAPGSPGALNFYPLTPCRVADTRSPGSGLTGAFGPPTMSAGETREFPIPMSSCGVPDTAQGYSLNIGVVTPGPLEYLTVWPAGQSMPTVGTLNSPGAGIVSDAAIVPAGSGGAISIFVSNATDVIIDIDGYFAP
jgi:hypothetical protein